MNTCAARGRLIKNANLFMPDLILSPFLPPYLSFIFIYLSFHPSRSSHLHVRRRSKYRSFFPSPSSLHSPSLPVLPRPFLNPSTPSLCIPALSLKFPSCYPSQPALFPSPTARNATPQTGVPIMTALPGAHCCRGNAAAATSACLVRA